MICKIKLLCAVFCFCAVALSAAEVKVPSFFKDWNEETHFDFTMDKARLNKNIVKLEKDPESEAGIVAVLRFPESGVDIQKCNKFMPGSVYSPIKKKGLGGGGILWNQVKKPCYNWYRFINACKLDKKCYIYCFPGWIFQMDLGKAADITLPEQNYELWMSVKFTGPEFPQGKKDEKNAIYIERIVLKKK